MKRIASLSPLRCTHRVRYRACTVRPVDRDCGDRDAIVESRGTSATSLHPLAEQRFNRKDPCRYLPPHLERAQVAEFLLTEKREGFLGHKSAN